MLHPESCGTLPDKEEVRPGFEALHSPDGDEGKRQ